MISNFFEIYCLIRKKLNLVNERDTPRDKKNCKKLVKI
jgi:hypothetical protein